MLRQSRTRALPFLPLSPLSLSKCSIAPSLRLSEKSVILRLYERRYSTESSATPLRNEDSTVLFRKLSALGPAFEVGKDDVTLLKTPTDFYNELKAGIRSAKKRISIAALYLGTGDLEKDLVKELVGACESNKDLEVSILLDCIRGSRGDVNSITMLQPLLQRFHDRVSLNLYHTPELRGILKKVAPARWNEVLGVLHIKSFAFDDRLLLSGANLSDSYFTNRQDRYAWVASPQVADFFCNLTQTVSDLSYRVNTQGQLQPPREGIDPTQFPHRFKKRLGERLVALIKPGQVHPLPPNNNDKDKDIARTWVFPTIQMGPADVRHDETVTSLVLSHPREGTLDLSSAYFNITAGYANAILNPSASHHINIITASPKANGFFNGKGMSGFIPLWYSCMERIFFDRIEKIGQGKRIKIWEYRRDDGWTFHAKGLWYSPPSKDHERILPTLTMLGSPNFGQRSAERDLEAQVVILTENKGLQEQLAEEKEKLFEGAEEVQSRELFERPERKIHFWVPWLIRPLLSYF